MKDLAINNNFAFHIYLMKPNKLLKIIWRLAHQIFIFLIIKAVSIAVDLMHQPGNGVDCTEGPTNALDNIIRNEPVLSEQHPTWL